jgi:hypothetical protein
MFYPNNQGNYYGMHPQDYSYNLSDNVYARGGELFDLK